MTERPIPLRDWEVLAILQGRKKQTRRVMKVQPYPDSIVTVEHYNQTVIDRHGDMQPGKEIFGAHWDDGERGLRCPYGAPGDALWVRETWCQGADDGRQVPLRMATLYRADGEHVTLSDGDGFMQTNRDGSEKSPWRPSIHMPRRASRITLRITDVRVERLQDIEGQHPSESDAIAEGVRAIHHGDGDYYYSAFRDVPHPKNWSDPSNAFREVWNTINGPSAWDANPWVWVISFERVKP